MTKEQRDNKKLIHDYALEPELIANCDQFLFRYLTQYKKFGWDTGCIVVQYPNHWRELVERLFNDNKRSELLLTRLLRTKAVRHDSTWNDLFPWIENAANEKSPHPFHVILAHNNPNPQKWSNIVCAEDISLGDDRAWDDPPSSATVNRTATSMAACIEPLLRYATQIHFIDPHFCPLQDRFKNPLSKFLKIICHDSHEVSLEYHTLADNTLCWKDFQQKCEDELPHLIPKGFTLTVRRWKNRVGGERFHNRYILTNIGGVAFGNSIAEAPKGEDNISRLSEIDSQRWLNKYSGDSPAFDLEGEVNIKSTL